jgi:hypothetical protein
MSRSRSLWITVPLFAVGCCALLVPQACFSFAPDAHYYYPTGLEDGARQLYAWPANGKDEFHFAIQEYGSALGDSHAQVETLHSQHDRARIEALVSEASSLTILLSKDSDPCVREDTQALVSALSRAHPDLSTHCFAVRSDLRAVQSGEGLGRVLRAEGAFHEESRPEGFRQSIEHMVGKVIELTQTPNFAIVPLASAGNRVAVYGDLRVSGLSAPVVECDLDEVIDALRPGLEDPKARELAVSWGNSAGGGSMTMSSEKDSCVFVAFYFPQGIPAERRAQCETLASRVCGEQFAPVVVALADTNWEWSACADPEFVRKELPFRGDWSFVSGPVKQLALLPKPTK